MDITYSELNEAIQWAKKQMGNNSELLKKIQSSLSECPFNLQDEEFRKMAELLILDYRNQNKNEDSNLRL